MADTRTSEQEYASYRFLFTLIKPLVYLLYPMRYTGRENIPQGPAIICANHSNYIDPVLASLAAGKENFIHYMAKKQFEKKFFLGRLLKNIGVFFVDRGKSDIDAIRAAMKYLKRGEKVFMFPEGTRTPEDNSVEAKTGAVRIASKLNVPIIPIYIPRRKKIFGRIAIHIGKPFTVSPGSHEDFVRASEEVMERIYALRDGGAA